VDGDKGDVIVNVLPQIPDVDYDVIKINQMGRHQTRTLRLTSTAMLNMRPDKVVSKFKPLSDIDTVYLEDVKTLRIKFHSEHDVIYESPIANQIVNDILARIKMFYKIDRKRLIDFELAKQFQMKNNTPSKRNLKSLDSSVDNKHRSTKLSSSSIEIQNPEHAKIVEYLHDYLYTFLYDLKSPEGRTIKHFVTKQILVLEKEPATTADMVRQFLDSMHQYILENRMTELENLIKERRESELSVDGKEKSDEEILEKQNQRNVIADIVMMNLESSVIPRVFGRVESALKVDIDAVAEGLISRKMQLLQGKPQSYFDIPAKLQSATNWSQSILELSGIETAHTPNEKIACLLASAKSIYSTHNIEKNEENPDSPPEQHIMGADDFLPIHIFVVCNSGLKRPHLLTATLWKLVSHGVLQGEGGYYLTVFESALAYIADMSLEKIQGPAKAGGLVTDHKKGTWALETQMRKLSKLF
jgi:hypothetical protein